MKTWTVQQALTELVSLIELSRDTEAGKAERCLQILEGIRFDPKGCWYP